MAILMYHKCPPSNLQHFGDFLEVYGFLSVDHALRFIKSSVRMIIRESLSSELSGVPLSQKVEY